MDGRINLAVATPCFGGIVTATYHVCMMRHLATGLSVGIDITPMLRAGDSMITRRRNELVVQFLDHSTTTHLLFIGADIGFEPEQSMRRPCLRCGFRR